jgi:lipopolysaccharide export system protein LptA
LYPALTTGSVRTVLCMLGWLALSPAFAAVEKPLDCPEFKSLCVQAERSGGIDLKSGTAILEGNVLGYIKAQELTFRAEALKAFRNEKNEWQRLVLDRKVRLRRPGSSAEADHSVVEPTNVLLFGNGRMEQSPYSVRAKEILIDDTTGIITARGSAEGPAQIQYETKEDAPAAEQGPTGAAAGVRQPPENMLIQAAEAVIEKQARRVRLIGGASIHRWHTDWRLTAQTVVLQFSRDNRLQGFRAEGDVHIVQPERTLNSDVAMSKDDNKIILLIGNASIQQKGEFQLTSDRLEVYTDAQRGVVQSRDRQQPIKLAFDLAEQKALRLDRERVDVLKTQGVPPALLLKLEPMLGKSYPARAAFDTAVRGLLTEAEAQAHLDTIAAHAK